MDRDRTFSAPVKDVYVYPLQQNARKELCVEPPKPIRSPSREAGLGQDWAEEEFREADFGDGRLNHRVLSIAKAFYARPQANIPQACQTRAETKATYRFFDNDKVKDQDILIPHQEATQKRLENHSTVLAIQDTTQLDFSHHPATQGLGILSDPSHQGLFYHPTLLVTPNKVALGIAHHQVWKRPLKDFGKKHKRKNRPISKKESQKWLNSLESTAQLQEKNPHLHLVNIADREADIFDFFLRAHRLKVDLLVRAAWNRRVDHPEKYLWDHMQKVPVSGYLTLSVPRKKGQPPRKARLSIRYDRVSLMPPKHRYKEKGLKPMAVWVVWAHEQNPPKGVEAISWMLITTIPVQSFEEALEKVQWYACRWQIELFFKILKSGCRIEARQLETAERIQRCLALDAVVAWRVLFLTMLSRNIPEMPCDVLLELEEWQALYCFIHKTKRPPSQPPTLKEATRMIAQLGGFLGRKSDAHPGPTTIWRGLQRLGDIAFAWSLGRSRSP